MMGRQDIVPMVTVDLTDEDAAAKVEIPVAEGTSSRGLFNGVSNTTLPLREILLGLWWSLSLFATME